MKPGTTPAETVCSVLCAAFFAFFMVSSVLLIVTYMGWIMGEDATTVRNLLGVFWPSAVGSFTVGFFLHEISGQS